MKEERKLRKLKKFEVKIFFGALSYLLTYALAYGRWPGRDATQHPASETGLKAIESRPLTAGL
jgi:hypothetical protein